MIGLFAIAVSCALILPNIEGHTFTGFTYGVHHPIYYYSYSTWSEVSTAANSWSSASMDPDISLGTTYTAKLWLYDQYDAESWNGLWEACCYEGSNMIDSNIYLNTRIPPPNSCCRKGVVCHEMGHALGLWENNTENCVMHRDYTWRHPLFEGPTISDGDAVDEVY